MRYSLSLSDDGRVLSATLPRYAPVNAPQVETLPEGDLSDYIYRNGSFVYAPLPVEYPTVPSDVEAGKVFAVEDELLRATAPIPKGEPVTRYNSEPVSVTEILNALEAQKGEQS